MYILWWRQPSYILSKRFSIDAIIGVILVVPDAGVSGGGFDLTYIKDMNHELWEQKESFVCNRMDCNLATYMLLRVVSWAG